jgi:hypothetical protein
VNDGLLVKIIHGGHQAILEFLFGCDTDMTQVGAGKKPSMRLSQEPWVGVKVNWKRRLGCSATQALVSFEFLTGLLADPPCMKVCSISVPRWIFLLTFFLVPHRTWPDLQRMKLLPGSLWSGPTR